MGFLATLTAALKAIPRIVDLFENLEGKVDRFLDARDDSRFEKFKAELNKDIRRLKNAKSEAEVRDIIRSLNPPK